MKPPRLGVGMRAVPRLCIELCPGIYLTTEENHGKTSVRAEPQSGQFYAVLNRSVSISEKKRVYCAVRAESVNIIRSIILPMLNTHLHIYVALTRRTNRRNLRTFPKAMYFPKREVLVINIPSVFNVLRWLQSAVYIQV